MTKSERGAAHKKQYWRLVPQHTRTWTLVCREKKKIKENDLTLMYTKGVPEPAEGGGRAHLRFAACRLCCGRQRRWSITRTHSWMLLHRSTDNGDNTAGTPLVDLVFWAYRRGILWLRTVAKILWRHLSRHSIRYGCTTCAFCVFTFNVCLDVFWVAQSVRPCGFNYISRSLWWHANTSHVRHTWWLSSHGVQLGHVSETLT